MNERESGAYERVIGSTPNVRPYWMSSNREVCFSESEVACERGARNGKLIRESYNRAS